MKTSSFHPDRLLAPFASVMIVLTLFAASSRADTVKLKSGETLEGRITQEGSDYIRLEIAVSATIKDTKVIARGDIAEIVKAAADDVALSELRKKLPVPSLTKASIYRKLIDSGPKKFLEEFPASPHRAEVEKLLADLSAEFDKVERGHIKLEGEWISPLRRKQFKALTDSRIQRILMKRSLAQGNFLGTLRSFEILEEQYWGSPAYATAIPDVKKLLPVFGQRLTRALRDVEYRNKKWEEDKALLGDLQREQVEKARAREIDNFNRAVEREKTAGIKWMSISDNSAESLSGAIQLVREEMERINSVNIASLSTLAEELVKADELIAEGKLAAASKVIKEATEKQAEASGSGANSSSEKTSYTVTLLAKIGEAEKALELAKKQKENAAKGEKITSVIKAGEVASVDDPTATEEGVGSGEMPAKTGDKEEVAAGGDDDQGSALTGLMGAGKKPANKEKDESAEGTPKGSKAPAPEDDGDGDDGDDSATDDGWEEDAGGGISFQTIMIIVAVVMVVVLVAMKVFGLGGSKD